MKINLGRKPQNGTVKLRLVVAGNAQAQVIAEAFQQIPAVTQRFDVEHLATTQLNNGQRCDVLFLQIADADEARALPYQSAKAIIRFPNLYFPLLWPGTCVNPYDAREAPDFPNGRFPYGDSYVANCVAKNTAPDEILPFCTGSNWPNSWPDLDRLFISEGARLTAIDNVCDVKMSSYIQKHFAKQRLFASPNGPSRHLLSILAARLLQCLPERIRPAVSSDEMQHALTANSLYHFLDRVEVPVHDAVAAHYHLDWHSSEAQYRYFDEQLNAREYFRRLITHSYALKGRGASRNASVTTLIVYGNCQAEAIARVASNGESPYRVLYLKSFDEPGAVATELQPEDIAQCSILWEQHDGTRPFPHREWLSPECVIVRFPSVDFNALWPFTCANEFVRPNPPAQPFGKFPYGDRIIASLINEEREPQEIKRRYNAESNKHLPDLDRLLALEAARLKARESRCDVTISDIVFDRFRDVRLFWTVNHPTNALLQPLLERLIGASALKHPSLTDIQVGKALRAFGKYGPLGILSVPIHPAVAEHYGLRWYDAAREVFQGWGGVSYSYDEYIRALIADSLDSRCAKAVE
jgi:uncharacterized protein (DUF952 family)